jgi:predicted neuraminidase
MMHYPHVIGIVRAPLVTDGKGNTIRNWSAASTAMAAAWVQPVTTDEQTLNQDRVVSRWRVFVEPSADIVASDRVTWSGLTFQVDGEVQMWDDRNGAHHHQEGFLIRVSG